MKTATKSDRAGKVCMFMKLETANTHISQPTKKQKGKDIKSGML